MEQIISKENSFVVQTINTTKHELRWHVHKEYELVAFIKGSGDVYISHYKGAFKEGDIYFLGSNLLHAFKSGIETSAIAIIIQFQENCLGSHFMNIPECKLIKELLSISSQGLKITGNSNNVIIQLMQSMEHSNNINRIILLLQCLEVISTSGEYDTLTNKTLPIKINRTGKIDRVIEFTKESLHDNLNLSQVAAIANMSIPSFSHYFKKYTGKTYIDYLNELRVNYACHKLLESQKQVIEICYESGYNSTVHFHKQFRRLKKTTPLQFRKNHSN